MSNLAIGIAVMSSTMVADEPSRLSTFGGLG
jgi:hypothetical protein